jgi:hypothetical protein
MSSSILNVQEMAKSAYSILMNLQDQAANVVGLDALWCRATPEINSEDIILQEYTLTNLGLECPKSIKIITSNADYNPGNFTVDLFGINYDAPLEVNVTINTWKSVYGSDTEPQQGDVVYIKFLHKLYEVKTSQVVYSIASMPTSFKCQLVKYNPTASRKETDEFRKSVEDFTVSQESLFGDAISEEVMDTVIDTETSDDNTTYMDTQKEFEMDTVIYGEFIGPKGTVISNAHYDMSKSTKPIIYHSAATYSPDSLKNHWIFTMWFRKSSINNTSSSSAIRKLSLYMEDKRYWYFKISTSMHLSVGDTVTITRGSLISITGEIVNLPTENVIGIKIKSGDCKSISRKMTKWYETSALKISKSEKFNLISSDNGNLSISLNINENAYHIKFGNSEKTIKMSKTLDYTKWTYIATDMSNENIHLIINQINVDGNANMYISEDFNETYKSLNKSGEFSFDEMKIDSVSSDIEICNIRLYENEYEIGETYKTDQMSIISRNASRLIVLDMPNPKDESMFYSPAR